MGDMARSTVDELRQSLWAIDKRITLLITEPHISAQRAP